MEKLLWILICFGSVLVILGIIAIVVGVAVTRPVPQSENESAPESDVWAMIAEKMLGWFDKLIGLLLSDDAPRSKRLTALGLILILLGGLCIAGGVFGISVVGTAAAGKAVAHVAESVEFV